MRWPFGLPRYVVHHTPDVGFLDLPHYLHTYGGGWTLQFTIYSRYLLICVRFYASRHYRVPLPLPAATSRRVIPTPALPYTPPLACHVTPTLPTLHLHALRCTLAHCRFCHHTFIPSLYHTAHRYYILRCDLRVTFGHCCSFTLFGYDLPFVDLFIYVPTFHHLISSPVVTTDHLRSFDCSRFHALLPVVPNRYTPIRFTFDFFPTFTFTYLARTRLVLLVISLR